LPWGLLPPVKRHQINGVGWQAGGLSITFFCCPRDDPRKAAGFPGPEPLHKERELLALQSWGVGVCGMGPHPRSAEYMRAR